MMRYVVVTGALERKPSGAGHRVAPLGTTAAA
jgi:hypothetical protein